MTTVTRPKTVPAPPEVAPAPPHRAFRALEPTRMGLVVRWIWLSLAGILAFFPFYAMVVLSLKPGMVVELPGSLLPWTDISFASYEQVLSGQNILGWLGNTLIYSLVSVVAVLFLSSLAGYAFAKKRFPGRNIFFWMIIATLLVPSQVTLVPLYLVIRQFNLVNNLLGVILPGFADVFGIFLMRQYIQTLPSELEEAARIDGCSEPGIFWRIILPLSKPAIGALAIFTFVRSWNAFLWPLIVLQKTRTFTLPVGVASLQNEFAVDYGLIFAGAAIAAVPMILFFLAFQRYFMECVRMGALKG
jgi:multiple sugar transport system permease protein